MKTDGELCITGYTNSVIRWKMTCGYHLCEKPLRGRQTKYCSQNCKVKDYVTNKRRKIKRELIILKGGCCQRCGYNKCQAALQFHHIKPEEKSFGIAAKGWYRAIDKVLLEVEKCVLLCANCHAELEYEKYS